MLDLFEQCISHSVVFSYLETSWHILNPGEMDTSVPTRVGRAFRMRVCLQPQVLLSCMYSESGQSILLAFVGFTWSK